MIQSMTGFAVANKLITTTQGKATISLSLKSLNGRFFELNCRIPSALSYLETVILKKLKEKLKRGHVHLIGSISNIDVLQGSIEPSLNTIQNYIKAITVIKKECNIDQPIALEHILRLPNVFNTPEQLADEVIAESFLAIVDELADKVIASRVKEGSTIQQDFHTRIQNMHVFIRAIETQAADFVERTKEQIQKNLLEIKEAPTEANDVQKNALYSLLDKIDIHEEISRFKSHLHNLENQLIASQVEKGKVLDFILQELVRETNTMNAKCSDATIAKYAIDAKVEIEKMREQVQNIV